MFNPDAKNKKKNDGLGRPPAFGRGGGGSGGGGVGGGRPSRANIKGIGDFKPAPRAGGG